MELLEYEYCYLKNKLHELFQVYINSFPQTTMPCNYYISMWSIQILFFFIFSAWAAENPSSCSEISCASPTPKQSLRLRLIEEKGEGKVVSKIVTQFHLHSMHAQIIPFFFNGNAASDSDAKPHFQQSLLAFTFFRGRYTTRGR